MERDHRKSAFFLCILVLSGMLTACSVLRSSLRLSTPTPLPTTVSEITADQAAQAMENDAFYSTYGGATLIVQGNVASYAQQNSHWMLGLKTTGETKVFCDLGSAHSSTISTGEAITVQAPAANAQRGNGSVILENCQIK